MQVWSDLTENNPTGASVTAGASGPGLGSNDTLFHRMSGNGTGNDGRPYIFGINS